MKNTYLAFLLIFIASSVFSKDYITKYSASTVWNTTNTFGKAIISGNIVTEVKLINIEKDKFIEASITKTMTPYGQVIQFDVFMEFKNNGYYFNSIDNWGNSVSGCFIFNDFNAELFLDCSSFSDSGKIIARLYGDNMFLHKTENDIAYFQNAVNTQNIKELLFDINNEFWPKNTSLEINYVGSYNIYSLYSTTLIVGESQRATKRLIILQNNEYLGHYYGLPIEDVVLVNNEVLFQSIELKKGNRFNLQNGVPKEIWIDGEIVVFEK